MTAPFSLACRLPCRLTCQAAFLALGLALAGCTSKPASEMPAAATTAQPAASATPAASAKPAASTKPAAADTAEKSDVTPMDRAEANAQCWMKYDKTAVSLEAKAKLVDKCSAEKMKGK